MDDVQNRLIAARRLLLQRLEGLERAGVEQIRRIAVCVEESTSSVSPVEAAAASPPASESTAEVEPAPFRPALGTMLPGAGVAPARQQPARPPASAASMSSLIHQPFPTDLPIAAADRQQLLDQLSTEIRSCKLCRELACTRKQTVFGVGNPRPRVVFFGEAPGADEDRQGEPFVGRAGQLLTKIIEACGWKRSDVYIMNTLKCRPPDNRTPLPDEVANCRSFFERQFEILRPEYIVCAGAVAAQALLETTDSVGKLRCRFYDYRGSKVVVTYHPSYLLRNPGAKRHVWDDMQMLLKDMGLPIPSRGGG